MALFHAEDHNGQVHMREAAGRDTAIYLFTLSLLRQHNTLHHFP